MLMVFYFKKCSLCFKVCYDCFSRLVSVHSCIFRIICNYLCIISKYIYNFKIVAKSNFKVVRVMCRCNLNNTRTKFHIYIFVCNNRNLTVYNRKVEHLSYHILVSVIFWIYCYSRISEKCLRSCCCKVYIACSVCSLVTKMPEMSCLILILNLRI